MYSNEIIVGERCFGRALKYCTVLNFLGFDLQPLGYDPWRRVYAPFKKMDFGPSLEEEVGTVGVGKERLREMPFACNIRLALTGLSKSLWKVCLLCHAIGILLKTNMKNNALKHFFLSRFLQ